MKKIITLLALTFSLSTNAQIITTIAGNNNSGYTGDGGQATASELNYPTAVFIDDAGNMFIADGFNNVIRKVIGSTGIITTIVGNGTIGYTGDGGPATSAQLNSPFGVFVDGFGNLFIAENGNACVRKVDGSTGTISTIAGNGTQGYSGDGGLAVNAQLGAPTSIFVDGTGNVYITDNIFYSVRKIDGSTGSISTIAGNG